ncbi:MAG: cell filamentation protein Fic [Geobacteraceae bacterium GWC2_55_20]|nr:MAG: cell filamentation protein Fic [Geobacteraceae bacterium GWC2_55_20]OGU21687.1 MAG: cell filamentation protein Fic [Geobacteraceae bacterium GWF2_54_21]HBA72449.1 cell filamentation protein Fic [Geobacter sp.]HCE69155.1 cell filamentation protein Fic [Geobacter sp.]
MKKFQSGHYVQQGHYKSFQPSLINRAWLLDDMGLIQLLGQADRELGRLDMYSDYIPNLDLFIRMHVLKEATQSSKIEGTRTNMEEALLDKEDVALDKRDDWEEVQNYVAAMNEAIDNLHTLPFSARLIKETHRTLLQGVRGKHKLPGEFRESQNWIGGATISDAVFVPPVHTSIGELISDIEKFAHNEEHYFPELLKIALIHYQFETIHPFLDGNGRVGRLMITLYLVNKGILKQPLLYLSDFFERNRSNYYDNLMRLRDKNDLLRWFKFFLVGVIETAKNGIQTFDNILKLQKQVEAQIQTLGSRASNAQKVLNYLYRQPLVDAAKVGEVAEISPASAYKLIVDLEQFGILKEITGGKRGKQYLFDSYLQLFR